MATSYDQHQYCQNYGRTIGYSMILQEYDIIELQEMLQAAKDDLFESKRLANIQKLRGELDFSDFPDPATTDAMGVDGDPGGGEDLPVTESLPRNY